MTRNDNQLPPIGPKPGFTPWGYDEVLSARNSLPAELKMEPQAALDQLKQRYTLEVGKIIVWVFGGTQTQFEVRKIDEKNIRLRNVETTEVIHVLPGLLLFHFNEDRYRLEE